MNNALFDDTLLRYSKERQKDEIGRIFSPISFPGGETSKSIGRFESSITVWPVPRVRKNLSRVGTSVILSRTGAHGERRKGQGERRKKKNRSR